jgi:hypothetical protein
MPIIRLDYMEPKTSMVSVGVSAASGALFKGVDSVLGKAAVAAGTSYTTGVATGFINSVNWDKLGTDDWIDGERMFKSAFGAGAIAGALSSGVMAGINTATSAKLDALGKEGTAIGKFYGGAIKLGALRGREAPAERGRGSRDAAGTRGRRGVLNQILRNKRHNVAYTAKICLAFCAWPVYSALWRSGIFSLTYRGKRV